MAPTSWSLAFVALVFACYLLVLGFLRFAARCRASTVALCALGLCAWLALTGFLAGSGVLVREVDAMPPLLMRYVMLPAFFAVVVGVALPASGPFLDRIPPDWLVSLQAFRIPVEVILHGLGAAGVIHARLTFSGLNFDIVTGVAALLVGYLMHKGRAAPGLVLAFNLGGLVLLAVIVTMAVLSVPSAVQHFRDEPSLRLPLHVPFVWLPGFLVPLALAGHLASLRQWSRARSTA